MKNREEGGGRTAGKREGERASEGRREGGSNIPGRTLLTGDTSTFPDIVRRKFLSPSPASLGVPVASLLALTIRLTCVTCSPRHHTTASAQLVRPPSFLVAATQTAARIRLLSGPISPDEDPAGVEASKKTSLSATIICAYRRVISLSPHTPSPPPTPAPCGRAKPIMIKIGVGASRGSV